MRLLLQWRVPLEPRCTPVETQAVAEYISITILLTLKALQGSSASPRQSKALPHLSGDVGLLEQQQLAPPSALGAALQRDAVPGGLVVVLLHAAERTSTTHTPRIDPQPKQRTQTVIV